MSTVRLTEERLRTWALAQEERERMCLGVMALDQRFSQVKPRRPKGGPDGGRDIEGILDGRIVVWGAVGFRASANDSPDDKAWVAEKLRSDIAAAKRANPDLSAFVFFTNVDLTPAELRNLSEHANKQGLDFLEIFYRERIRIALDSGRGLHLRFQYLGMTMSDAEQAAFFAEYGRQLESAIHRGFTAMDERLQRLEFLHECANPLRSASIELELKRAFTADELGHFRFMAQIIDLGEPEPHPTLWLCGRDAYGSVRHGDGTTTPLWGIKTLAWSRNPDGDLQNTVIAGGASQDVLSAGTHLHRRGPFSKVGDLDHKSLSIYVTEPLYEKIAGILVVANEFVVAAAPATEFVKLDHGPLEEWREPLAEAERAVPWSCMMVRIDNPPEWMPPELAREGWGIDYRYVTPRKRDMLQPNAILVPRRWEGSS